LSFGTTQNVLPPFLTVIATLAALGSLLVVVRETGSDAHVDHAHVADLDRRRRRRRRQLRVDDAGALVDRGLRRARVLRLVPELVAVDIRLHRRRHGELEARSRGPSAT
jgi:hypothetical protein